MRHISFIAAALLLTAPAFAQGDEPDPPSSSEAVAHSGAHPSPNAIVDAAPSEEWVRIPAEDLLVMTLAPDGDGAKRQVVIQLMPAPFSQGWVSNIRTLARARWYDGISVNRVQDNYVVQWGDPNHDNPASGGQAKPLPEGLKVMGEEEYASTNGRVTEVWMESLSVSDINDLSEAELLELLERLEKLGIRERRDRVLASLGPDPYSARFMISRGWPVAQDGGNLESLVWPVHCYGMVGVGRGYSPDTGSGAELYTVIGHAPRHLDRNIALVGRIIEGMEHLSSMKRGSGPLGFYTEDEAGLRTPIQSIRVASDMDAPDQPKYQYLSTESESFARYAEARANRRDPFFIKPAGGADICNIPVPVRPIGND